MTSNQFMNNTNARKFLKEAVETGHVATQVKPSDQLVMVMQYRRRVKLDAQRYHLLNGKKEIYVAKRQVVYPDFTLVQKTQYGVFDRRTWRFTDMRDYVVVM